MSYVVQFFQHHYLMRLAEDGGLVVVAPGQTATLFSDEGQAREAITATCKGSRGIYGSPTTERDFIITPLAAGTGEGNKDG